MSDDFAICNNCGSMNTLANIQLMYPQAFLKKESEMVECYFFCLKCRKVQLRRETKYHTEEYFKEVKNGKRL